MKWLFKYDRYLGRVEEYLLTFILVGIVVLYSYQTILRNVLQTGADWIEPIVLNALLFIAMLGGSLATLDERHICVDITDKFLSKRAFNVVLIITNITACIACWFFAMASTEFIQMMREQGHDESAYLPIPFWIVKLIIPVGFYLISTRFFIRALEHSLLFMGVNTGRPHGVEDMVDKVDVLHHFEDDVYDET